MSIRRFKKRISHKPEQKYFQDQEAKETLKPNEIFSSTTTKPEAKLLYTYKNGSTYLGEWVNGFRHGEGKMTWVDGASYEG